MNSLDILHYDNASYAELAQLTRYLISMPIGDLTKLWKTKRDELGTIAPSAVYLRAVLMTRVVAQQRSKHAG